MHTGAARASKEDVLLLYANKWCHHVAQSCVSLAQLLQVPDAAPLHRALQAAWPFTDQVSLFATLMHTSCVTQTCRIWASPCSAAATVQEH